MHGYPKKIWITRQNIYLDLGKVSNTRGVTFAPGEMQNQTLYFLV